MVISFGSEDDQNAIFSFYRVEDGKLKDGGVDEKSNDDDEEEEEEEEEVSGEEKKIWP